MRPMKKGLSLPRPAGKITCRAIRLDGTTVSDKRLPPLYLNFIKRRDPTTHPIAAIPLEPSSKIRVLFGI